MKNTLHKIAEWFRATQKLKMANSYIKYLEEQLEYLDGEISAVCSSADKYKRASIKQTGLAIKTLRELKELKAIKNDAFEKNKRLLKLLDDMRNIVHKRGSTDAELIFMKECVSRYAQGKTVSKQSFDKHMYKILKQRAAACINRNKVGVDGEGLSIGGELR